MPMIFFVVHDMPMINQEDFQIIYVHNIENVVNIFLIDEEQFIDH